MFHAVRAFDATRRLRALSADELQRRVTFDSERGELNIGFVGLAAALGVTSIVKWACSGSEAVFGPPDEVQSALQKPRLLSSLFSAHSRRLSGRLCVDK